MPATLPLVAITFELLPTVPLRRVARRPPRRPPSFDRERFLSRIRDFQHVGMPPSLLVQLRVGGIEVSPPEALAGDELERQLWDVVHALAALRVFVVHTDHLSDAELYDELVTNCLVEPAVDLSEGSLHTVGYHFFDLVDGGGDEEIALMLRYYADDETRAFWAEDCPEIAMPERENPPYDRDACLPAPPEA